LKETVSNGFADRVIRKTVGNGSRDYHLELDHRAKAAVLMRSLCVPLLRERGGRF
jgi:hypothetical protein